MALLLAATAPHEILAAQPRDAAAAAILDSRGTTWRLRPYWRTPRLLAEDGQLQPLLEKKTRRNPKPTPVPVIERTRPPVDWVQPGFDDSQWARARPPFRVRWWYGSDIWTLGNPADLCVLCVRGRFAVSDPTAVKALRLSLEYHGGVVVYLNGAEVARRHMPRGKVGPETLAEPYPPEAYIRPDGKLLHFKDAQECADRIATRTRKLSELPLPAERLRKGVNVLAIAAHRAPVRELLVTRRYAHRHWRGDPPPWPHAELTSVRLDASGSGAVANVARPKGRQAWNAPTAKRVYLDDFGDPNEALRPLSIVGARNGAFCGQVVFSSTSPMKGLTATMTELRGAGHTIAASAVEVFYPRPDGSPRHRRGPKSFDTLRPDPPQEVPVDEQGGAAVQPLWLKVRVPRDAMPGHYAATLTLAAEGAPPTTLPVELTVHDYALPDPRQYRTFVDIIQSPESVALYYKVPLWSDAHFERLGRSLALLSQIGNKTTYLRLLCRTHFGNTQSILRFVREADGSYRRDYRILDRYLDLVIEKQGRPAVVVLYVWERYTAKGKAPLVTELDPATGQVREMAAPSYGTPEGEAFWAPVFRELRQRMAERGLADALMLGCVGDFNHLTRDAAAFFSKVASGMPWVSQGHGLARQLHGVAVGYATHVWGVHPPREPTQGRQYGWQRERLVAQFARDMFERVPLPEYRQLGEWNLAGGQRGFGRIGGDFWRVLDPATQRRDRHVTPGMITHRFFEEGKWGQLVVRTCMLAPGRDGALSTVRFEMLREGIQDCEARIFIEKALTDPALRAKLGDRLAAECQQALDQRTRVLADHNRKEPWFFAAGFTRRTDRLYAAAAAVAARLRGE